MSPTAADAPDQPIPAIPIIIPSAHRPERVLTRVTGARLYVPESQADAYRAHNPGIPVDSHADDAYPNLPAKRQALYQRHGSLFMLDDDIQHVFRLHPTTSDLASIKLSPDEAAALIHATADVARRAGCHLFGFASHGYNRNYNPLQPISLTDYINASAIGLHPSSALYFSPHLTGAESFWLNGLNAHAHRRAWCDRRYCFKQQQDTTLTAPGGQAQHRTLATERADSLHLRRCFGDYIQPKAKHPGIKLLHRYQRTTRNPL